jgi:hypothetical protein
MARKIFNLASIPHPSLPRESLARERRSLRCHELGFSAVRLVVKGFAWSVEYIVGALCDQTAADRSPYRVALRNAVGGADDLATRQSQSVAVAPHLLFIPVPGRRTRGHPHLTLVC